MRIKQNFDHLPIVFKLSLFMLGLICMSFLLFWLIIRSTLIDLIHQQTNMFGSTIASQTAHAAGELLLAEDQLALKVLARQTSQAAAIIQVRIIDSENRIVADSKTQEPDLMETQVNNKVLITNNNLLKLFTAPIIFQDVTAGQASILIDQSAIATTLKRTLRWAGLALVLIIVLSAPVAYFLSRYWTEPIRHLTRATTSINAGALETRLAFNRQDEFGELLRSFNEMAHSLQERETVKSTFYRYVGSGIANQVLFQAGDPIVPLRAIDATVVFFDIVSFTRLCQNQSAQDIAQMLNQYYACVQMCCAEFGGIVDKYIGDGALVVFGADNTTPHHARNALMASHLFRALAKKLIINNPDLDSEQETTRITFRIALHSGKMLAGTLGHKDRLQYTVIGDTVNVAARLCQQAPIDQVILSKTSCDAINELNNNNPSGRYLKPLGLWQVRGRDETVAVYQSLALPQNLAQQIDQRKKLLAFQLANKPNLKACDNIDA